MDSNLSASDIALLGNDGGFGGGNAFLWIFALLILAGGGFGGLGGQNNATKSDVQDGFNFSALERQNNETIAAISAGSAEAVTAVKDANYNTLGEIRDLQAAVAAGFAEAQKSSCETLRSIDAVNYNAAINTANINANTTAQVQKVLDAISTNRMADMQAQINQLQMQNAMAGVVRYPNAWTYNAGASPFCGGCTSLAAV